MSEKNREGGGGEVRLLWMRRFPYFHFHIWSKGTCVGVGVAIPVRGPISQFSGVSRSPDTAKAIPKAVLRIEARVMDIPPYEVSEWLVDVSMPAFLGRTWILLDALGWLVVWRTALLSPSSLATSSSTVH